jgi:menaquinone-dependent protoporphyrinogen oxidase
MKALIVYGTRSGATKGIADEIAKALTEKGYTATVANAKESKGVDVKAYDLVVVGSSVWATWWSGAAKGFLRRNQRVLAGKKVALFSSGLAGNDPAQMDYANQSIAKVAANYPELKPLALAYFGGYIDFNSGNFFIKMVSKAMKEDFAKKGVDTSKPYDGRNLPAVHQWALELADKAR